MEDFIKGLLTKTLNKTEDELTALIYEKQGEETKIKPNAIDLVLAEEEKRIQRIKNSVQPPVERLKGEYSKGRKEAFEDLEKQFREKYGYDADARGLELISGYIDSLQKSGKKTKDLSDDEIKIHPAYLSAEKKWQEELKNSLDKKETEFNQFRTGIEREKKMEVVRRDIRKTLESIKPEPVFPADALIRNNQIELFLNQFSGYDYEIAEDGNHVIIKDGKRFEDSLGNIRKFNDIVTDTARKFFEFKKQDSRDGAGNGQGNGQNNGHSTIVLPKNKDEFNSMMANAKTKEERMALADWALQNKS